IVESTPDHVVFLEDGEREAKAIGAGDRLRLAQQPDHTLLTTLTEDEAWLLGILVAEGSILADGKHGRVYCHDEAVLTQAAACWERVAAGWTSRYKGAQSAFGVNRTPVLNLRGNGSYLRMLRRELYCADGSKRVPIRVL